MIDVLYFYVDFSLKSIDEWRNLFYIVIDTPKLHDFLIQILPIYKM